MVPSPCERAGRRIAAPDISEAKSLGAHGGRHIR